MTAEQVDVRKLSPVRFVLPAEATIFAGQNVEDFPFPVEPFIAPVVDLVSTRRKQAGRAFQRARERRGLFKSDIKNGFSGRTSLVTVFERGQAPVSLPHALTAAQRYFEGEDYDIRELQNYTEEEQWIQTLTNPGMTAGRAVKLLRLYNVQTKKEFAKDAGIASGNLSLIESGQQEPKVLTLNQLISASSINPDGIPAQIIRLMGENREPMSLRELQTCSFGELIRYIRQLKGLSAQKVGNLLEPRKAAGTITHIERSKKIIDKTFDKQIVAALGVNPRSALAEVLTAKIESPKEEIPQEMITRVFTGEHDGQFVFAEHIYETAQFQQKQPEKLLKQLDEIKNVYAHSDQANYVVNALLTYLRSQHGTSTYKISANRELTREEIGRIERNEVIPTDVTIMKILNGLGYDIHDPITSYILDIAETVERRLS